jgi:hypothetical protein
MPLHQEITHAAELSCLVTGGRTWGFAVSEGGRTHLLSEQSLARVFKAILGYGFLSEADVVLTSSNPESFLNDAYSTITDSFPGPRRSEVRIPFDNSAASNTRWSARLDAVPTLKNLGSVRWRETQ